MALHPMSLTLVILASRWDKTGRERGGGEREGAVMMQATRGNGEG